jgi:tartrate dehydratase beta subunit/fumarate hydratase class I family protein
MVMPATSNRPLSITNVCLKHGGFYRGSVSSLAQDQIEFRKAVAFPELGMKVVWIITVESPPVLILIDDKGYDFLTQLNN